MPQFSGLIEFMALTSYRSIWFWAVVIAVWTGAGRSILGVPVDVMVAARRDPAGRAGMVMLDWLTLTLPRRRVARRDGMIILAVAGFALGSLMVMGFALGLETAQALALIGVPLAVLGLMRVRLAARLAPLVDAAHEGGLEPGAAAAQIAVRVGRHRRWVFVLSVLAVAATALWASLWGLMHPFGRL